jgi:alpha-galactosidase
VTSNAEQSVSIDGAFASITDSACTIGNEVFHLSLAAPVSAPLGLQTLAQGDLTWSGGATSPFGLWFDGGDDGAASFRVIDRRIWTEGSTVRLAIDLAGDEGQTVTAHYEAIPGQAIIRSWLGITSGQPVTISRVEPIRLAIASPAITTLHTVSGVQRQGGWRPDHGLYRSFRLEEARLEAGQVETRYSGPRSTWDESPWAVLSDGNGNGGLILALEYGAQWELTATPEAVAFAPLGIAPELKADETWTSPPVWIGAFSGDLDAAAAVMHRYLREAVLPATDDHFPWVQYNTWFSWYCELEADLLLAEADIASLLGVEVFYVDAGWWVGNPERRDRFSSGLGNWLENRDKFPEGLKAFADGIRERGMHFGLWVEPERVDLRTATTGTWKPEWIAMESPGRYVRCDWPSDTETAWLCFGNPETQDWATDWIGNLVEDLGIRWLKWDSNYWGICTSPDHGHGVGDAEAAQVAGVQVVMQRLRDRFPDLVIENCAGGATRMDFALARQTPAAWLNDASEPAHRSRFHNAGASYMFPPEMLNAWITESEHESVNGHDLPDDVWRMVIRSRMLGAMGFSCRLATWSEHTVAIAREEVERYRNEWRPLMRHGAFRHLLLQPEMPSRDLPTPDTWEAYQVSAPNGGSHIVLGFRNVTPASTQVVFPGGLDAGATYDVTVDGAVPQRLSGADLNSDGLTLSCPLLTSTWVTIQRVDA